MFAGSPVKEPPPPGSPHRAPSERDAPFLEPSSFIFQSPRYTSPFQVPQRSPYEDSRLQSLCYITFRVLRKGTPLHVPLTERT